jgi:dihydrodipicolinate synthase/N-acetylneuraminate lyase
VKPNGTYPMLYAFFDEAGALRRNALTRQIEAALHAGAAGIAILGLATEANKLTRAEKRSLVDWAHADIGGRAPLAVTIGEPNLAEMIESARAARSAGADWLILQPPRPPISSRELLRFFGAVAENVDCPIGIQNAPEFLGVGLSPAELVELNTVHPNISIVKAESSALSVGHLIDTLDRRMAVFNGRAGLELTDNFRAGVDGMIPGIELIDLQCGVERAMRSGNDAEAEALYRHLLPFVSFAMQGIEHLVLHGKLLAALRLGLAPSGMRIPSDALTARGEAWVRRFAGDLGPLVF